MEDHYDEKDLVGDKAKFMALTNSHLTRLLSAQFLHEQANYFAQLSLLYYRKYNATSWHIAWILNEIGSNYDMKEELDSADCYYQKALEALNDTSVLLYRDIKTHQACLEYKKNKQNANLAIEKLLQILSGSKSDWEKTARYASVGEVLFYEKQFDSALYCFNIVFQNTTDIRLKKQVAEWLVEICKIQGRESEMIDYANFLVPFANQEENKSEIKSQLTEIYKAYSNRRLERQYQKETKGLAKQTLIIATILLFVILIVSVLYYKNKRHKQRLEILVESERQSHKIQQAALGGRLKRSNDALKEKETRAKVPSPSVQHHKSAAESYEREPICQHILAQCNNKKNPIKTTVPVAAYADIAINDAQLAQLKDAAMHHYGSMFEKLKLQHPKLKDKDLVYCYLSLLGLDNAQIAVLLQNSISTIWDREKRLKRIFGSEDRIAIILYRIMKN